MMKPQKYTCLRCGSRSCVTDEISTAGNILTRILHIQSKRFTAVICTECRYAELYHLPPRRIGEVLDIQSNPDKLH